MKIIYSQSVTDFLVDMFPQFSGKVKRGKTFVDAKAANCLYSIWNNEKNQLSAKTLKVTSNVKEADLNLMQQEGLIKKIGSNIEITEKGKEIIKIMILGDEKSIFDRSNGQIDFKTASQNVDTPSKLKKQKKKIEDTWWGDLFRR
jgi:predicted methyltransferase